MHIIGVQLGHNATACLLRDGKVLGAASQEKFDNVKNSSAFPDDAIRWLLEEFGVEKADLVAVSGIYVYPAQIAALEGGTRVKGLHRRAVRGALDAAFKRVSGSRAAQALYWRYLMRNSERASAEARGPLEEKLLRYGRRVTYVEHHVCHAYASYYALSRDHGQDALVLTLDGSGDRYAATVNLVEQGRIKRLASTRWIHSLGYVYSFVTTFLGMKPLEHEYKVMGLAPYAKEQYVRKVYERVFKPLIWLREDRPLEFDSAIPTNRSMDYLRRNLVGERFDNVAGAVQMLTEDLVTGWVRNAIAKTGVPTIYTGGGVFMNVKANMQVAAMPEVRQAYFMPSCGDESNPFGAAYHEYLRETGKLPQPLDDLYLGPRFSMEEIAAYLKRHGIAGEFAVEKPESIEERIADLLAGFQVVARFAGRAEWGARSLGNRAIIANPSSLESFYEVNDAIKQRDFWMPFAPSILAEEADRYLVNPKGIPAPHMILGFETTPLAREHLRAAMHQADKTVRPQLVTDEANVGYARLIRAFRERTGIGAVMNTSFNLHGYPLVATLDQAFFTFRNSGLKHLALEGYLVSKR